VEQVAEAELGRDGDGARGQAQRRARRSFVPVARSVLPSYLVSHLGMEGGVHAQWCMRNHVVSPRGDHCLVANVPMCHCEG
jgi:hypothetical protein